MSLKSINDIRKFFVSKKINVNSTEALVFYYILDV